MSTEETARVGLSVGVLEIIRRDGVCQPGSPVGQVGGAVDDVGWCIERGKVRLEVGAASNWVAELEEGDIGIQGFIPTRNKIGRFVAGGAEGAAHIEIVPEG